MLNVDPERVKTTSLACWCLCNKLNMKFGGAHTLCWVRISSPYKAYRLWSLVFRSFGISWVLPRSVADTLFGWWNWFGKHSSSVWNLDPLCLMWCLWRERNWRTFEDMESSDDQLLASFSGSLFDWSRA